MIILRTVVILALFLCAMANLGCGGGQKANVATMSSLENANSARTNIEELGMVVNIPYEAEDIVWKETADHKQVTGVLRFSPQDANRLVTEAADRQSPLEVKLSSEPWFPAELIAQADVSGDDSLNGLAYDAEAFYQEPYTAGRVVRIVGTNYFVLELSAK